MSATALPAESDRSDFRTVMLGGTKLGLVTAVAVVAFLAVSRQVTAHVPQRALETLIVLAAGAAASFLPAQWAVARFAGFAAPLPVLTGAGFAISLAALAAVALARKA